MGITQITFKHSPEVGESEPSRSGERGRRQEECSRGRWAACAWRVAVPQVSHKAGGSWRAGW